MCCIDRWAIGLHVNVDISVLFDPDEVVFDYPNSLNVVAFDFEDVNYLQP